MASMKEIREHIASIQSTQKVTNAMYLIASTKMRRAKEDLAKTRPFFDAVLTQIEQIFQHAGEIESPYLYRGNADDLAQPGTYAYLVVTADRGLAGAYNQNVIQETMKRLEKHPDSRLFVVGGNGRHFFSGRGVPVEKSFRYDAQSPTLRRAREITAKLLDLFDRGEISKLFIIYTDLGNGVDMDVRTVRLLPLEDEHFAKEETAEKPIRFEPSAEEVLARVVPAYITGFLYSAMVDSFCAERARLCHGLGQPERGRHAARAAARVQPRAAGRHHERDHGGLRRRAQQEEPHEEGGAACAQVRSFRYRAAWWTCASRTASCRASARRCPSS